MAGGAQTLDRAAGIAAVAKIVSHHHVLRAQPQDDRLDESLRSHRTHALIEVQRHQTIDSERRERQILFAPAGEARRRAFRIDELLGTRLEHQHRRAHTHFTGAPAHRLDHLPVPKMHTVVVTHGEHTAASG